MKWQAMLTIAVLSLVATATGGKETPTERRLLALDLRDGSRLRGSTGLESIPLDTAYGKLSLPTKLIRTVTFTRKSAKGETWTVAAVELRNGDRLHGRVALKTLELDTPYGKSAVPTAQIVRMAALPDMPAEGLVAFWTADGDTRDAVGGHHGTVGKGVCYTADRHGNASSAFLFNGRGGFVTVPDSDTLDTDCAFTVSAWVNPTAYKDKNGNRGWIISKWHTGNTHGDYALSVHVNGQVEFLLAEDYPGKKYHHFLSGVVVPKNTWTHLAASFDHGVMKIYLNGKLVSTHASRIMKRTDPVEYVHDDVTIGALWDGAYSFTGAIDDVGIWNRALSGDEIAQLAGAPEVKRVSSKAVRSSAGCAEVRDTDELSTLDSKQIEQGEKP